MEDDDGTRELLELISEYEAKEASIEVEQNTTETPIQMQEPVDAIKVSKKHSTNIAVPMDKVIFGNKKDFIKNLDTSETTDFESNDGNRKRKPAWVDNDDKDIKVRNVKKETKYTGPLDHIKKENSYKDYLTTRFTRIMAQPKWAQAKKDEKSQDDEILGTVGFIKSSTSHDSISPTYLRYKLLKDLNHSTYSEGNNTSVQFHPNARAALVSGQKGIATIYSIDGKRNEKLHSLHIKDFMIKCTRITPCGSKAIFGAFKNYYYLYDLIAAKETRYSLPSEITNLSNFEISPCGRFMAVAGRFGLLHLFDVKSQELLHSFKQEDDVAGICFTGNSQRLICSSFGTMVHIYSIRAQRIESSFYDDGCVSGSALDLSPNQRMLATGSREGIVNVYNLEKVQTTPTPVPEKTFYNLTTSISDVKFNHTSEVLAMCSAKVPCGIKLAHFPSATVYSNFPTMQDGLKCIRNLSFSPSSAYLGLGTRSKEVNLFRLKYFKNY